jgi:hypothetical protein
MRVEVAGLIAVALLSAAPQVNAAQCPRAEVVEVMPKASADTRSVAYQNGTIYVSRTPISTLKDIAAVGFLPETPWALTLTFKPEVEDRMERITGSRPRFAMAFVVDNDAIVNVVLEGGFGIGKGGLQVSVDRNDERIRRIYDALSRCVGRE